MNARMVYKHEYQIPKIRFKGYFIPWSICKLNDACKITPGRTPLAKNCFNEARYPLVCGKKDFENNKIRPKSRTSQITKISKKGDFLLTTRTPVGHITINNYGLLVIGRGITNIQGNYFIYALLNGIDTQRIWNKFTDNLLIKSIRSSTLRNLPIMIPNTIEQHKIGKFFKLLNRIIQLQNKKMGEILKLKHAYMQKLFPSKGSFEPFLRFHQFRYGFKWIYIDLISLASKCGVGGTPPTVYKEDYGGNIPFLNISDIKKSCGFITHTKQHITNEGLNDSHAWIVKKNNLSISMSDDIGEVVKLKINCSTSQSIFNLVLKSSVDSNFIYYIFQRLKLEHYWNSMVTNNTLKRLNAKAFESLTLKIPVIDEQKKISQLLSYLDKIFLLNQKKLNILKTLKKGYLQKMFIYLY